MQKASFAVMLVELKAQLALSAAAREELAGLEVAGLEHEPSIR